RAPPPGRAPRSRSALRRGQRALGEDDVVDVALADLDGLAQHPDLLVRARVLTLEDLGDVGLAHLVGLGEHPDLLAALHVRMVEDVAHEVAPQLARLAEHPALLALRRHARSSAGDDV